METDSPLLAPPEQVLSTLNPDGTRKWVRPKVAMGRWWRRRQIVAWVLIVLFTLVPWLEIGGKPVMRLDFLDRQFVFFGTTFDPTDTLLLTFLLLSIFLSIFFLTALFGRVWCGWACPQTVYLEFLFRPIERFLEKMGKRHGPRTMRVAHGVKWVVYAALALHLANTFISYFVGPRTVLHWSFSSPALHPAAFSVVMVVTVLILIDFGWFREQMCTLVCPYARLQSVLLDEDSLIVAYDERRGEPRGKLKAKDGAHGDCIDCKLCVAACPTGIDIRDGLQLECIACTQCIDACDAVMDKIERPRGLIRYTSKRALRGERPRLLRPRVVLYPLLILGSLSALTIGVHNRDETLVRVLRVQNTPFVVQDDGSVLNPVRVMVANRSDEARTYELRLTSPEGGRLLAPMFPLSVPAGEERDVVVQTILPGSAFHDGRAGARLELVDDTGAVRTLEHTLAGPLGAAGEPR